MAASRTWEGRPGTAVRIQAAAVAVALIAGSGLFGAMISLERSPWFGLGLGLLMAVLFLLGVGRGSSLALDGDGWLVFTLAGKANVRFPLSAVRAVRPVAAGALRGVGIEIAKDQVTFLHKSGITYRTMDAWRRDLEVDLVLEHLDGSVVQDLTQLLAERPTDP